MSETPPPVAKKPASQGRLKRLFEEYGTIAIVLYIVLCVLFFGSAYAAIQLGWRPESIVGQAGTFGAAYVVYKATMPVRIAAAVLITPLAAKVVHRFRPPRGA